jgi:hypothetical protein
MTITPLTGAEFSRLALAGLACLLIVVGWWKGRPGKSKKCPCCDCHDHD